MGANIVEIILKAVDKASAEFRKVEKSAEDTGKTVKKASTTFVELGAAATAAGVFLKKAFDFAKDGAEIERAEIKFDRLARSIGTTSDALMRDLKPAVRGTMSDAELMASAGDLMALGLAKTHDQAVRLTSVAGALGMNMNQLVLTLTNQTTMRFDALGVSVAGFDKRLADLKATGMDVNDAFTEAFLLQAEDQVKKVGEYADTAAGQIAKMEASVTNLGDAFKKKLVPVVSGFSDFMFLMLEGDDLAREAARKAAQQITQTSETYIDYGFAIHGVAEAAAKLGIEVYTLSEAMWTSLRDAKDADAAMLSYAEHLGMVVDPLEGLIGGTERYTEASSKFAERAREGAAAIRAQEEAANAAAVAMQNYFSIFDNTEPADVASDLTDQFSDHLVDAANNAVVAGEDITPYLDALRELDPVAAAAMEQSFALTSATAALDEALLSGKISGDEYADAIEAMTLGIEAGVDPMIAMETQLDKLGIQIDANKDGVDDFRQSLETLVAGSPYTVEVMTVYTQSGSPGGGGGGTVPTVTTPINTGKKIHKRAAGGPVAAGEMYWVGERREPELFVPSQNGTIVPGNKIGGNTYNTYHVTIETAEAARAWDAARMAREAAELRANL